jgi:hypothetical protein
MRQRRRYQRRRYCGRQKDFQPKDLWQKIHARGLRLSAQMPNRSTATVCDPDRLKAGATAAILNRKVETQNKID